MMERHTWTIEQFGSEHNARAEALAAEEQRAARFGALDEAGPCELCGWSGTMVVYYYHCPDCGVEGVPLTGIGLGWAVCVNAACPRDRWQLTPVEEPCPNGCRPDKHKLEGT